MSRDQNDFENEIHDILTSDPKSDAKIKPQLSSGEKLANTLKEDLEKKKKAYSTIPSWVELLVRITAAAIALYLLLLFALRIAGR